jgi:hypothetical protein
VASGVRSVGLIPVPPVVMITETPSETAARSAAATGSPSGTTSTSPTSKPRSVNHCAITGPVLSWYTPAAARFDAAITRAVRVI